MKFKLPLFLLFFTTISWAQVGVGTTAPAGGSMLDVSSTDKGLLVPRVNITDLSTIAPITGGTTESLLVYNTNTTTGVGFHYWDGSSWVQLGGGGDKWDITGNSNIGATNFLGTTNANPLRIYTDNTQRMLVDNTGRVGIGEAVPDSQVDVVQTHSLGASVEISHDVTTNTSSALWVKNNGTGLGFHLENLNAASNVPAAHIYQLGNSVGSDGLVIEMDATTSAAGLFIDQYGSGRGSMTFMPTGNASPGSIINHSGTGDGMQIFQLDTGDGLYTSTANGVGIYNYLWSNSIGTVNSLINAGGTGEYIDLFTNNGTGVRVIGVDNPATPTVGGNVYSFYTDIRTATPTTAGTVYGAAFAGIQSGNGHGIIINHSGTQGRNAEFNITNPSNPDPAIFTTTLGTGSAVVAQNQNNSPPAAITVGDFAYTGTDVDDHIGVYGYSVPTLGWGIGVEGSGDWNGVAGISTNGYAVAAYGDFAASGTKAFLIDHPHDPANMYLKHFSIESDEVLNVYRGSATFDANGKALVALPSYYEAVNRNPTYQLTPVGASMPNLYIEKEVTQGEFLIAGGVPGKKVSWTITAERNDPYLQQFPEKRQVEVSKGERSGKYVMPEAYNQPKEKAMYYRERPEYTTTTTFDKSHITNSETIKELRKPKEKPTRKKKEESNLEEVETKK